MLSRRVIGGLMTIICVINTTGCTHLQLQRNTNRQARTVSDIYEQQVLDNLALFVTNPYATPFFSVPFQGTNTVDDKGTVTLAAPVFTSRFWSNVGADGSRDMNQAWTLNPVIVPQRLKLEPVLKRGC